MAPKPKDYNPTKEEIRLKSKTQHEIKVQIYPRNKNPLTKNNK
jgi:hypothetical protein